MTDWLFAGTSIIADLEAIAFITPKAAGSHSFYSLCTTQYCPLVCIHQVSESQHMYSVFI